jgi:predicted amidohydrolase
MGVCGYEKAVFALPMSGPARLRLILTQPALQFSEHHSRIRDIIPALDRAKTALGSADILVLPELIAGSADRSEYLSDVRSLSENTGAWVVGGSHYWRDADRIVNCGIVANPRGQVVATYEKSHPYDQESHDGVTPGNGGAFFEVNGVRCFVLICADFWYASSFNACEVRPDIVIVPAFSVSQRPIPALARARWKHAAIARAYEFMTFIAISDWASPVAYRGRASSGVGGLAHPNPAEVTGLFQSLGRSRLRAFELDIGALDDLRVNRDERRFCPPVVRMIESSASDG